MEGLSWIAKINGDCVLRVKCSSEGFSVDSGASLKGLCQNMNVKGSLETMCYG